MSKIVRERIYVELHRSGTGSFTTFGRASSLYGLQVWSEIPWTMPPGELSGAGWCQELYLACLTHLEAQA
jgi:hypothetical protein